MYTYLDSEFLILDPGLARFQWDGHEYEGRLGLDASRLERLWELEGEPLGYGAVLFRAVFAAGSPLREGFREAAAAARTAGKRLRFRLHFAAGVPVEIHALYWELLYDEGRQLSLARSPDTAFSRYCTVPHRLGQPTTDRPRLLGAVSAPDDADRFGVAELDRACLEEELNRALEPLRGAIDYELLKPPVTAKRLRQRLTDGRFHALHVLGHGLVRHGKGASLLLEDAAGSSHFVEEAKFADVFEGNRDLRLITLMACRSGATSTAETFSGLAGRLVERGLPAVVALRHALPVETARPLTRAFYGQLAAHGRIDAALNEARHELSLDGSGHHSWSCPMLFMRLEDGRVWRAAEPRETVPDGSDLNEVGGGVVADEVEIDQLTEKAGSDREIRVINRVEGGVKGKRVVVKQRHLR